MSLPIELAGKPITAEEAQFYIEKQLSLKKSLKESFLNMVPKEKIAANPLMKDANTYFDSDVNAFIFSKDVITRFFEPIDAQGPKAEFIMVIMGAKYLENEEKGNPTIIVAGVNQDLTNPDTFLSLDIQDPATEQPPKVTIPKFPGHAIVGPKHIEFKIL